MTNKYHCKIFFSLLILILGVFPFTTAHSQSAENTAVYVLDSKGSINGNSIFITGKVANLLPYKVSDLTVQAIFITNGDYQTQVTNIDVIEANSSASFLLSFQISPAPEKYVVEVVEYRIETNDVNRLIEYFWNSGEDNALRVSAAASLSTLPAASRDEVLLRFSTSPIEINETSATVDLIEDLLLLPYLETHPSYDVAESMITRVNLYRNPEFSTALENLKNIAGDGNTIIPKLDQAATKDLNLSQIIEISLINLGNHSIPALVRSTYDTDLYMSSFSQSLLNKIGSGTIEEQLSMDDLETRLAIIEAIGGSRNANAVIPLLVVAGKSDADRKKVKEILSGWDNPNFWSTVISGLELPDESSRRLAFELVYEGGGESLPYVNQLLLEIGLEETSDISLSLKNLTDYYDRTREAKIDQLQSDAFLKLSKNDCLAAEENIKAIYVLDNFPDIDLNKVSEIYLCNNKYLEVIRLFEKYREVIPLERISDQVLLSAVEGLINNSDSETISLTLDSLYEWYKSPGLARMMSEYYVNEGLNNKKNKQTDIALSNFKKALLLSPSNLSAQTELGKIYVSEQIILVLSYLIFIIMGLRQIFKAIKPKDLESGHEII